MKPVHELTEHLLDNSEEFNGEFFRRFHLRRAPEPLQLSPSISKDYLFPVLLDRVTCAVGVFLCDYKKAASLIATNLSDRIKPVGMTGGRALVGISAYQYNKVLGMKPYNEIALALPVMVNTRLRPPILPLFSRSFRRFGYYIAAMFVTSEENTIRGRKIWGLPKITRELEFLQEGEDMVTLAREENGEEALRLVTPRTGGAAVSLHERSFLYTRHNGLFLRSPTEFQARFNIRKNIKALFGQKGFPGGTRLTIGQGPSMREFRELEIDPEPLQTRYTENMQSSFDLPDSNPPAWLTELNAV